MRDLARYFKLLGDANRLAILKALDGRERSVTEVIHLTGLSQTLVSFHLRALREGGVVSTRRQGPFIYYRITNPELTELLEEFARLFGRGECFDRTNSALNHMQNRKIGRGR